MRITIAGRGDAGLPWHGAAARFVMSGAFGHERRIVERQRHDEERMGVHRAALGEVENPRGHRPVAGAGLDRGDSQDTASAMAAPASRANPMILFMRRPPASVAVAPTLADPEARRNVGDAADDQHDRAAQLLIGERGGPLAMPVEGRGVSESSAPSSVMCANVRSRATIAAAGLRRPARRHRRREPTARGTARRPGTTPARPRTWRRRAAPRDEAPAHATSTRLTSSTQRRRNGGEQPRKCSLTGSTRPPARPEREQRRGNRHDGHVRSSCARQTSRRHLRQRPEPGRRARHRVVEAAIIRTRRRSRRGHERVATRLSPASSIVVKARK